MEQVNSEKKNMSGAQRRQRARRAKKFGGATAATNVGGKNAGKNAPNGAKAAPKVTGGGRQPVKPNNGGKPKDQRVAAPAGVTKKNKNAANNQAAIQSQAFDLVRQKLVASLLQILPSSNANWGNNPDQSSSNAQGGWNGNNNNNNKNMNRAAANSQGAWSNNNNNANNNRAAANLQGNWNNNNSNMNRAAANAQGAWNNNNNNNMNRAPTSSQGPWTSSSSLSGGLSTSFGLWNNNNNMGSGGWNNNSNRNSTSSMSSPWGNNNSLSLGASNAWSNNSNQQRSSINSNSYSSVWNDSPEAPAPPPWNNGDLSASRNEARQQSSSTWGNGWGDDPRNAGGREFFQQLDGGDAGDFDDSGSGELRFSIVDMNTPGGKILGRRQQMLKGAFSQALADLILKADSRYPPIQIKFSRFIQDTYKISVASPQCVPVLQNLVDRLPGLWPGSKLRLIAHPKHVKLTKASLFIRSGGISRASEDILLIIERQNAGLKTDKWRIIHRREKDDGVLLIVAIDRQSIDYLDRSEGKVFFLTSNAIFKLAKKPDGPVGGALAIMPKSKSKSKSKPNAKAKAIKSN